MQTGPHTTYVFLKIFQIKTMKFPFPCGLRNMTMSTDRIKIIIVLLKLANIKAYLEQKWHCNNLLGSGDFIDALTLFIR